MTKQSWIVIVIIAVIVVAGIAIFSMKQQPAPSPAAPQAAEPSAPSTMPVPADNSASNSSSVANSASPVGQTVTVTMNAQNGSGISGTATLTDVSGQTKVELKLTGQPQGMSQPAHIHTGSCANLGAVKYPLTFPMNGTSETIVNVSLGDLLKQLPLAINVHKSSADIGTYVSCGDIMASGTTSGSAVPTPSPAPAPTPAPAPYSAPTPSSGGSYGY